MSNIKIGIAGTGTVGSALINIIEEKSHLLHNLTAKQNIEIKAIASRTKKPSFQHIKWFDSALDLADDPDIDIVIELVGGAEGVAYELCKRALTNKKDVVTANKDLIAKHGNELTKIAEKNKVSLLFEAAVAGAIPIIKTLKENLSVKFIREIRGILNGTCNYILTEMEKQQQEFAPILQQAQEFGYAEADPLLDIGGFDAAHKLSIIAALAFKTKINFDSVDVSGVDNVKLNDIKAADFLGYRKKHLGICKLTDKYEIHQEASVFLLPKTNQLATIDGTLNSIMIISSLADETILTGRGAGGRQTASAVLSDIIDISRAKKSFPLTVHSSDQEDYKFNNSTNSRQQYFIRSDNGLPADLNPINGDFGAAAIINQTQKQNLKGEFSCIKLYENAG